MIINILLSYKEKFDKNKASSVSIRQIIISENVLKNHHGQILLFQQKEVLKYWTSIEKRFY